jgi:hypothetical protein
MSLELEEIAEMMILIRPTPCSAKLTHAVEVQILEVLAANV